VAAQALHVHRHTMRNRIARIEHIAGKRLDTAQDRFELWLALASPRPHPRRGGTRRQLKGSPRPPMCAQQPHTTPPHLHQILSIPDIGEQPAVVVDEHSSEAASADAA
jgi:hypothetical protein